MLHKTNIPGYMKDSQTGLVVNQNMSDLDKYKAHRKSILENNSLKQQINDLETQFQKLVTEVRASLKGNQ